MVQAGLLVAIGDKRGRHYRRSPELEDVWHQVRSKSPVPQNLDPYADTSG